jgi:hypothetical protein
MVPRLTANAGRSLFPTGTTKRPPSPLAYIPLAWSRARYFHGVTYGKRFHAYGIDTLVPALQPGDTVILDNLLLHKAAGVGDAIECMRCSPASRPTASTSNL